jgi:hypothetical protein
MVVESSPSTLKYEPAVGVGEAHFVIVHGRYSANGRPQRSRLSSTTLERRGVPSVVTAEAAAHGILGEERVRAAVVLPERNEHVVVGDQALATGRELRQKSRRVEALIERPLEGRDTREEVREGYPASSRSLYGASRFLKARPRPEW